MNPAAALSPAEAARQLGVSQKALRLYEQHGLIAPLRAQNGWRSYGPAQLARAAEIVAFRALGLSLAQSRRLLDGDTATLAVALATHQQRLDGELHQLTARIASLRRLRQDLATGSAVIAADLLQFTQPTAPILAFDLPWPWGGERFELRELRPLTYIVGPLGSGKTRLARHIAETLPCAIFLGPERLTGNTDRLAADPALATRVTTATAWLIDEGATASPALTALLAGLESQPATAIVVDMVEDGLDHLTQDALAAWLRTGRPGDTPLILMTRSSAILDLDDLTGAETIILCPANHSPPTLVAPLPGAPGTETLRSCLAPPETRARTAGVIAMRPAVA